MHSSVLKVLERALSALTDEGLDPLAVQDATVARFLPDGFNLLIWENWIRSGKFVVSQRLELRGDDGGSHRVHGTYQECRDAFLHYVKHGVFPAKKGEPVS
jgi:hypothetical protein